MKQDLTQLSAILLCDDSTGCDEMDDYFAINANTTTYFVCEVDLNED